MQQYNYRALTAKQEVRAAYRAARRALSSRPGGTMGVDGASEMPYALAATHLLWRAEADVTPGHGNGGEMERPVDQ